MLTRSASLNLEFADLANWKLLENFQKRLQSILDVAPKTKKELDPRCPLLGGDYFSLNLFGLLNPVIKTSLALCAASSLVRMQTEVCQEPMSLTSFSDMQAVANPELLAGMLRSLSNQALPVYGDPCIQEKVTDLIANDGTRLPAMP